MKLQFDNILTFIAVVEEGTISAASRKLRKSQSTVSTAIQNLESDLGFELFIREKNKVYLTDKGERFFHLSNPLGKRYSEMMFAAKQMSSTERIVFRIGVDPLVYNEKIKQMLVQFSDQFPNLDLSIIKKPSFVLANYLNESKIDIAIGYPYHKTHIDFNIVEMFQINFWWVSHKNMKHEQQTSSRWLLLDGCGELVNRTGMGENNSWYIDDFDTIVDLCVAQKGIAFLPESRISLDTFPNSLEIIRNHAKLYGRTITASLFWPTHSDVAHYTKWFEQQLNETAISTPNFVANLTVGA